MSDSLSSVVRSYFHGILTPSHTQQRLQSYDREHTSSEKVVSKRESLFSPHSKIHQWFIWLFQTRMESLRGRLLRRLVKVYRILSIPTRGISYLHLVPVPQASAPNFENSSDIQVSTKCYCCSFTSNTKRKLDNHKIYVFWKKWYQEWPFLIPLSLYWWPEGPNYLVFSHILVLYLIQFSVRTCRLY